jgi:hypothetical protein
MKWRIVGVGRRKRVNDQEGEKKGTKKREITPGMAEFK